MNETALILNELQTAKSHIEQTTTHLRKATDVSTHNELLRAKLDDWRMRLNHILQELNHEL